MGWASPLARSLFWQLVWGRHRRWVPGRLELAHPGSAAWRCDWGHSCLVLAWCLQEDATGQAQLCTETWMKGQP